MYIRGGIQAEQALFIQDKLYLQEWETSKLQKIHQIEKPGRRGGGGKAKLAKAACSDGERWAMFKNKQKIQTVIYIGQIGSN